MRTLTLCLTLIVALSLAATAAFTADEAPAAVSAAPSGPPAAAGSGLSTMSSMGEVNGSHFDVNLYLNIPELFRMLAKVGAIPQDVADRALAASKAEGTPGDASASYVKIEAHIQIAEIAPLLAVMAQTGVRRVPRPEAPSATKLEKPEKRPPMPPAK